MIERITFTTTTEGVFADHLPEVIRVSPSFLKQADRRLVSVKEDIITFTLANGRAQYKIVARGYPGWDGEPTILRCRKVD